MKIDLEQTKDGNILITTLEPVAYTIGAKSIIIPPGYISDGLSVPRIFWSLLSPQCDGRTLHAGLAHDHAYEHHTFTRAEADAFLRDDLIRHGFNVILAWIVWAGVRLFGWAFW